MSGHISVSCPHCQQKLKIKDLSLLGKTVKCPGCKQPVTLQIPEVVPAKPPEEVKVKLVDEAPAVGTSPKWVPDAPVSPPPPAAESPFPPFPQPEPAAPPAGFPVFTPEPAPPLSGASTASSYLQRRRKKSGLMTWIVSGVLLLMAGGVTAFVVFNYKPKAAGTGVTQSDAGMAGGESGLLKAYSQAQLEGSTKLISEFKPTSGKPIELFMVPSGVSVVLHLRPAQLWSTDYEAQVLRSSLTSDVTNWLETTIQSVTHRKPEQIDELLIGLIVGARGTKPDVCAVIHLKAPEQIADLVQEFKGTYLHEDPIPRIKVNDTHAYLIHDEKTIAICPAQYAGELEDWIKTPNYEVPEGVAELLKLTDRDRLFTIVGEAGDLRRHVEALFPEPARLPMTLVNEFLGEQSETVCWTVHTQPYLHSELHLRPVSTSDAQSLKDAVLAKFNQIPQRMWKEVCDRMQPQELRFRKIVGRFPAMLEAFRESTVTYTSYRQVTMTTVLPAKAAANLALATMFTVNEAERTDFSSPEVPKPSPTGPTLPDTIAERLKLPVDVEFNRTPLEQAFAYLCEKLEVNLAVDGDALKDAGYTKNMPQTMTLGKVPAEKAFAEIIGRYQEVNGKMVVWLDEGTRTIHVTTEKFAQRENRTLLKLLPE